MAASADKGPETPVIIARAVPRPTKKRILPDPNYAILHYPDERPSLPDDIADMDLKYTQRLGLEPGAAPRHPHGATARSVRIDSEALVVGRSTAPDLRRPEDDGARVPSTARGLQDTIEAVAETSPASYVQPVPPLTAGPSPSSVPGTPPNGAPEGGLMIDLPDRECRTSRGLAPRVF